MPGDEPHGDGPADCGESDGEPFDLRAVLSDDELLDALGPDGLDDPTIRERFADSHPHDLVELLLSVRESAGAGAPREPDGARLAPTGCDGPGSRLSRWVRGSATGPRRRSRRISLTLGAAVLVAALFAASIGAGAAEPGDALWPVTNILYPERAESVRAAAQVSRRLDAAATAMEAGDDRGARIELQAAESQLGRVRAEDGGSELQARHGDLDHALRQATRTGGKAGTRATTPSTGPEGRGPAAYPVSPTPARDGPTTVSTTTATITTGQGEGARRRTSHAPAGPANTQEAPRTTAEPPEQGRTGQGRTSPPDPAPGSDTARPADQPRPPDQPRPLKEGRPADQPRPHTEGEGRPADQPRHADQPRSPDQPRPHTEGRPAEQPRPPDQAHPADQPRRPDQARSADPQSRARPDGGSRGSDRGSPQQPSHGDSDGRAGRTADSGTQGQGQDVHRPQPRTGS
jgi:hypothetical protein